MGTGRVRPRLGWAHARLHPAVGQGTVRLPGEIVTDFIPPTAPVPAGLWARRAAIRRKMLSLCTPQAFGIEHVF